MMLVHIRKYHMNKDDNDLALSLNDVDDITLDDNMDNESEGSVESGEILAGEAGDTSRDMVSSTLSSSHANPSVRGISGRRQLLAKKLCCNRKPLLALSQVPSVAGLTDVI